MSIFKSYSFRRQFRRQFSTVSHVILQAPSSGITATALYIWRVSLITSKAINGNSVKFDWVFLKVIHLDVNSDINSIFHVFAGRQLPCKFHWLLSKLLMRLVGNLIEYFKSYSFRRQFRRQFLTVFHVILQAPSAGITAIAL